MQTAAPIEPLALSLADASRALGIPERTLRRMAEEGTVPASRVGKLWKFQVSKLRAWLDAAERKAAS